MSRREEEEIGRAPAATPGSPAYRPHRERRREEELIASGRLQERPMGHISLEADISAIVGDFEIKDVDLYAVYGAERATDIPLGASFEIHADYMIVNRAAGFLDLWSTSMTVRDSLGNYIGSDDFGDHRGGSWLDAHDAINAVFPADRLGMAYTVKIFANQEHGAGSPPQDIW